MFTKTVQKIVACARWGRRVDHSEQRFVAFPREGEAPTPNRGVGGKKSGYAGFFQWIFLSIWKSSFQLLRSGVGIKSFPCSFHWTKAHWTFIGTWRLKRIEKRNAIVNLMCSLMKFFDMGGSSCPMFSSDLPERKLFVVKSWYAVLSKSWITWLDVPTLVIDR